MKIGFVLDDGIDSTDGVQQYVLTLGKWLDENGHEVHYLSADSGNGSDRKHSFSRLVKLRFNKNQVAIPLPASPKQIKKILDMQKFDVLHVQMPYSPMLGERVIKFAPITSAIVGTFHIAPHSKLVKASNSVLGFVLKPSLKRFDEVVAVSEAGAQLAESAYGLKPQIVPNTVDVDSFKIKSHVKKLSKTRIIFLGRLVPRKGCEHLIEAINILKNSFSNFEVIIVGDGPQRSKLEQKVARYNLSSTVVFKGAVSEDDKRQLLASSTIAVYPATGGESFGIVLIEAMAAGVKAVLGGDNPGYREVLKTTPRALFTPGKHQQLANLLKRLLSDNTELASIFDAQQAKLKDFDISTVGPKILSVYRSAIAKRKQNHHNVN